MPNFNLNISFNADDLNAIITNKREIILVKQNNQGVNLAWIAFQPFEHNTLEWTTEYSLYCSNTELRTGAKIVKASDMVATPAIKYMFRDTSFFSRHQNNEILSQDTYYLKNEMEGYSSLSYGLAQDIYVNGRAFTVLPINAATVPYGHNVSFTPCEAVNVFLGSGMKNSMVISNISLRQITLVFGNGIDSSNIKYSNETDSFYQV